MRFFRQISMKKSTFFFAFFLAAILLTGCETIQKQMSQTENSNQTSANDAKTDSAKAEITDNNDEGICSNEYYPVNTDSKREYKISGTSNATYVLSQNKNEGNSFTEKRSFASDMVVTNNWQCTDEGLRNADFNNGITASNMDATMETLESSGVTLPKVWETGKKWTTEYKISVKINVRGISAGADGNATVSNEIGAIDEKIKVPGGEFSTARIDSEVRLNLSMKGKKLPTETMIMSIWYAPQIGLVKQEAKSSFGKDTIEFTGEK